VLLAGFFIKTLIIDKENYVSELTSNVVVNPKVENGLIEKSVSSLILDSRDIEAGYDLDRENSGYENTGDYEHFIKTFEKIQPEFNESLILTIDLYKFKSVEDSKKYFNDLEENFVGSNYNKFAVGDNASYYRKRYFYDFVPVQNYEGIFNKKKCSCYGQSLKILRGL